MHGSPLPFDAATAFDAENRPLGQVVGFELTEGTREPTSLLIEPAPELQGAIDEEGFWLDVDRVAAIRRGSFRVDTTLADLVED